MTHETQKALRTWIEYAFTPTARAREQWDAYGLKHEFERQTNIYVTEYEFAEAMAVAGHTTDKRGIYRIKPANTKRHRRYIVTGPHTVFNDGAVYRFSIAHRSQNDLARLHMLVYYANNPRACEDCAS